jgi:hypothetical protein
MKCVRKGREYEYPYKTIVIKEKYHKSLKGLSDKENIPMGILIKKLVDFYENSNR